MRLDIVIPAHNEEHRIDRTLTAYRAGCPHPATHFHVALDDCTDRTAEIVRGHQRADGRIALHEYPKLGKGGVIAETFRRSDATSSGSSTPTARPRRRSCCGWPMSPPAAPTPRSPRATTRRRCCPRRGR